MQHTPCLRTLQVVLFTALLVTFAQAQAQKYVILSNDLQAVNAVLRNDNISDAKNLKYNKAVVASLSAETIKKQVSQLLAVADQVRLFHGVFLRFKQRMLMPIAGAPV